MKFKFSSDYQFKLIVEFDSEEEKRNFETCYFKMNQDLIPFAGWIEAPGTKEEDKKPYWDTYNNAQYIMSMVAYMFECAGYTSQQIRDVLELPF